MKILICGGDERSVLLAGMLKDDGHEVLCFCMDKAQLPDGVRAVSSPEQAMPSYCLCLPKMRTCF